MTKIDIEIYGVSPSVTQLHRVQLDLEGEPDLNKLLGALKAEIPALSGIVIDRENNGLMGGYMLNVDGQFCNGIENKKLAGGEHIVLLSLASGG